MDKNECYFVTMHHVLAEWIGSYTDCVALCDFWDVLTCDSIQNDVNVGFDWQFCVNFQQISWVHRAWYFSKRDIKLKVRKPKRNC